MATQQFLHARLDGSNTGGRWGILKESGEIDDLLQPVRWAGSAVELVDQTELPVTHRFISCSTVTQVADAIRGMKVRGAPAIGVTAGYGMALAVQGASTFEDIGPSLAFAYSELLATRPTAVNLRWALDRMRSVFEHEIGPYPNGIVKSASDRLVAEARAIHQESYEADLRLSALGAQLLDGRSKILTHCNAGPLATAGYGTAIGVIRKAYAANSCVKVFADETRPFLQGARLTAWELTILGIPVTVITDGMAGHLMRTGEVEAVIVGADRIARNGDVANKIGTYGLAVLAAAHDIPFYVAAPTSTVDLATSTGDEIPIEERSPDEVTTFRGIQTAPDDAGAIHPAFDVTPARLVTAVITELGIAMPPSVETIAEVMNAVPLMAAK